MARPRVLTRPLALLGAGLLVAGVLQTSPASADPGDASGPALSLSVAPAPVEAGSYPGGGASPDRPARLGRRPGSVELRVWVSSTGSEPVHDITVTNRLVVNGATSQPACAHVAYVPPEEPQPAPVDDLVLEPGQSVVCSVWVSGVMDQVVHDDVTTATVRGVDSGATASQEVHFYATADDDSVAVGDRVWLDTDRDGVQDAGEPGIGGARLVITGPGGDPVPDFDDPTSTIAPQTTDSEGRYLFTNLPPAADGSPYTVTVDPTSPSLEGLAPTLAGVGSSDTDSSTGSAQASDSVDGSGQRDLGLDFGFVTPQAPPVTPPPPVRAAVALTADASPEPAITGSTITVKGSVRRAGHAYAAATLLEFQPDGSSAYARVATVRSSSNGTLSASVGARRSGTFRYRFAGDATTEAGVSAGDHLDVRKATVRLTVAAPGSVVKGRSITIKGSIKREGKKYRAATVLELRRDGQDAWSKVKSVKSTSKGALSASVRPSVSGAYRYRYAGSSTTEAGVSGSDHVTVKPKPRPKPKPKAYKNCTALTKVYPHGVGRSGAEDQGGGVTDFTRDTKTYNLNKKSDRDKDGIACER